MKINIAETWEIALNLFTVHLYTATDCCQVTCHNQSYRTVPLSKISNSEDLEGEDGVRPLPQQVPASHHEQEGSIVDMPSSNKASDATSDSSEDKQAPSQVTEVSTLKVFWVWQFIS
jgi:hypothetical protein